MANSTFTPTADLYDVYDVRFRFVTPLSGGVPKSPDLIDAWVRARTGYDDARAREVAAQTKKDMGIDEERVQTEAEAAAEKSWSGFKSDAEGLYIEARQVEAMLKETASVMRLTVNKRGSKQVLQHACHVKPYRIHLGKTEPDGYEESVVHATTPQGPIHAIKRNDYVSEGTEIAFTLHVLRGNAQGVDEDYLRRCVTLGQDDGLGANRSQGFGRFEVVTFACANGNGA